MKGELIMSAPRAWIRSGRAVAAIGGGVLLTLLTLGGAPASAGNAVNTGLFGGVAIMGYDPVAYFTEGRPMKGSEEFAYEWLGTPWYFANSQHRDLFIGDPVKYAPQYGGYCAVGVGLPDAQSPVNIDPERAWRIIDGKLYFVYDPTYVDGPHRAELLKSADANWPTVKARVEHESFN
jgi:YHS domain-containing protein